MDHFVRGYRHLLLFVCASVLLLTVSSSTIDDTLWDDEDSVTGQKGEFTLELESSLGCTDWKDNGEGILRNEVKGAIVLAMRTSCRCNITSQSVFLEEVVCASEVRNRIYLSGEISPSSDARNISLLLGFLKEWSLSGPVLETEDPLGITLSATTITIVGVTTQVVNTQMEGSGSGSGELIPTDYTHYTTTIVMETETKATPTNDTIVQEVNPTTKAMPTVKPTEQLPQSSFLPMTVSMATMLTATFFSLSLVF